LKNRQKGKKKSCPPLNGTGFLEENQFIGLRAYNISKPQA
jgi:hypothetical protein